MENYTNNENKTTNILPIIPLRGKVAFPHTNISFEVGVDIVHIETVTFDFCCQEFWHSTLEDTIEYLMYVLRVVIYHTLF